MCRSNLFRYIFKEKSFFFFSITCWTRHYFVIFFIYCSVSVRIEKNYIYWSTGNNSLIQTVKYPFFNEKNFLLNFYDAPITPLKTFLKGEAFLFFTPFWNDCEMFIVTRSTYTTRQTRSITEKQCDHLLIFLVILEAIRRNRHLSRVERPKIFRNKQKLRARNIG